jgi:hypothetical protein
VLYLVATQQRKNRQDMTGKITGWKSILNTPPRPLRRPDHRITKSMSTTAIYTKNLTGPCCTRA